MEGRIVPESVLRRSRQRWPDGRKSVVAARRRAAAIRPDLLPGISCCETIFFLMKCRNFLSYKNIFVVALQ
jgi:hypothetical protein